MPLASKKLSALSTQATLADDDLVTGIDTSAASPGAKNVNFSLLAIANWVLAKYATVTQAEAEARSATTVRWWTAQRVGQAIAAGVAGIVSGAQHNWAGSRAPLGTDDNTDGYSQGSLWRWSLRVWVCVDATTNVAVWVELTGGGGTGGDVVTDTSPQLGGPLEANGHQIREAKGADVPSSATLAIGNDGNYFVVTGTTAITAIAAKGVGTEVTLQFSGVLTLTHSTDLVLPTGSNITTATGDVAKFVEHAAGDWRCVAYQRASGAALSAGGGGGGIANIVEDTTPQLGGTLDANAKQIREAKGADVASATNLAIGNDGNYFVVTGTTTIATIAAKGVGTEVTLQFAGALILTNSADLVLPTAGNITTAAGDVAKFIEHAAGDWRCVSYLRKSGAPVATAATPIISGVDYFTASGDITAANAGRLIEVDSTGGAITLDFADGGTYPANAMFWVVKTAGSDAVQLTADTLIDGAGASGPITLSVGYVSTIYRVGSDSFRVVANT